MGEGTGVSLGLDPTAATFDVQDFEPLNKQEATAFEDRIQRAIKMANLAADMADQVTRILDRLRGPIPETGNPKQPEPEMSCLLDRMKDAQQKQYDALECAHHLLNELEGLV